MSGFGQALQIFNPVVALIQIDVVNDMPLWNGAVKKFPNFAMKAAFTANVITVLVFVIGDAEKCLMSVVENLRCVRRRQILHFNSFTRGKNERGNNKRAT